MANFNFSTPKIDFNSLNDRSYAKKVYDQLLQMNENLRYMFENLDNENFSSQYNEMIDSYDKGINSLVKDLEGNYSLITQTATEIRMEVGSFYEALDGRIIENKSLITQTATQIRSEVSSIQATLQGEIIANQSLITQTATEIRSEVTSKFNNYSTTVQMQSAISQSASSITSTVSTQINGVTTQLSQVKQTADKIDWLVKSGTSSSNFTLTDRVASLVATAINITGYVTFSNLANTGQTTINGSNITTGTIDANKVTVINVVAKSVASDWVYAGSVSADKITTGTLNASKVTITNLNASNINTGTLDASKISVTNLDASSITTGTLDANKITVKNLNANNITSGALDIKYLYMGSSRVMYQQSSGNTMQFCGKGTYDVSYLNIEPNTCNINANYTKIGIGASSFIGFFGNSGSQKTTVTQLGTNRDLATIGNKLFELIAALKTYNII